MKGVFPPAVPGLAPGLVAAGYQCYCSRVRRGERCGHQPSTSLYPVYSVYPVYPGYPAQLSQWCQCSATVSHGGSRPGWDEDGATLHPVHTLAHTGTGTITGHGVTAAQWAALNRAGTMYCHASSTTRPPAAWDRSGYQWLNKAKWHITPSQVRCQVEFLNFDIKASRSQD